ncbi:VWA domain-containing protein [Streptomyces melanogenes]|uniref:VWA domain-containing protein n=1 Tax=Streptomyces melanogenes TaxID=67326 RepID=UPI0037B703E4
MPTNPSIEADQQQRSFQIKHSKAFISSFSMKVPDALDRTADIVLTYPKGAETALTLTIALAGIGSVNVTPTMTGTSIGSEGPNQKGKYDLTFARVLMGPPDDQRVELTCNINRPSGGAIEVELRAKAPGLPALWDLKLGGAGQGDSTLHYLACDPQANLAEPQTGKTVFEQEKTRLVATQVDAGSVVLGHVPPNTLPDTPEWQPHYTWDFEGKIAITDFPFTTTVPEDSDLPVTTSANTYQAQMPGVYEPVTVKLKLSTSFGDPKNQPFLTNDSSAGLTSVTVSARPQHVALVLDRSGSMADETPRKWDRAVEAAQLFTHLLTAFREGVNEANDRLGVVTFSADKAWPEIADTSRILTPIALSALPDARTAIGSGLGAPDGLTPIGDGLVAGLDLLAAGAATEDRRLTLVVLTDGQENAGSVYVGPTPPATGGQLTTPFRSGLLNDATHGQRNAIRNALYDPNKSGRMFAIGLGADVDKTVLNGLAGDQGFLPVAKTQDLAKAFARILNFSQEVAIVNVSKKDGDPAAYLKDIDKSADRMIFAVLGGFPAGHSLRVETSSDNGTTWNTQPDSVVKSTRTDGFMVAWVPAFQKVPNVPTLWRVTHLDAASPAAPVVIAQEDVLAFVDLHIKADLLLDKNEYLTGDDMDLTVRIRHDDKLVLGAKVRAELVAPAVGTGSVLSERGADFGADDAGFAADGDNPPLHGRMIREALRRNQWDHWPQEDPDDGLFEDGTDELHDVDGDGNYTNTFARVWKEGAYTWNLFVDGKDTDGNPFNRVITVSTFAGIKVSRRATTVTLVPIPNHPSKLRAVRVIVTPQDVRHERLGPNKDHVVFWELHNGTFEHVFNHEHPPVFTDGTYQRVVLYRQGDCPTLRVEAADVLLPTIRIPAWVLNAAE